MKTRLLIITLILMAAVMSLPAQEEPPVAAEPAGTEEQDPQVPVTPAPEPNEVDATNTVATPATDSGEPALDSFRPSEEISADRSVAFPNDI